MDICELCTNPSRKPSTLCVVEDIRDVIAIENTHQFKGKYHVLGGIISPMDGVGPADLNIESLVTKVAQGNIKRNHNGIEYNYGRGILPTFTSLND